MALPTQFYAGDVVTWTDDLVPTASTYVYYLRTNAASGATVSGTLSSGVWTFTIAANVTTNFTPGQWFYQAISVTSGVATTQRSGGFEVLRSLAYAGAATAIDLRSQTEIDLTAVELAIRTLVGGAQEYRIGTPTGGRLVKRADLAQLIAWRDRLKADLARERIAQNIANGKGDGRQLFVRFT